MTEPLLLPQIALKYQKGYLIVWKIIFKRWLNLFAFNYFFLFPVQMYCVEKGKQIKQDVFVLFDFEAIDETRDKAT